MTHRSFAVWALPFVVCIAFVASACTQEAGSLSGDVGGPCGNDDGCNPESYCERGKAFPQGMCSIACSTQEDCILSTVCSERGMCLMSCYVDGDCRPGYACIDEDRPEGGTARVCANPAP